MAGDKQAFKGRALQRRNGVDGLAGGKRLLVQGDHFPSALYADDQAHVVHLQQSLRLPLGEAARGDNAGGRMLPGDAAHELQGFLVAGAGDGAGIDEIHVRLLRKGHDFVTRPFEGFQHGLGVVLIHLAAQGMKRGFHGFSSLK